MGPRLSQAAEAPGQSAADPTASTKDVGVITNMSKGASLGVQLTPIHSRVPVPVHPLASLVYGRGGGGAATLEPSLSLAQDFFWSRTGTQLAGRWECGGRGGYP